MHSSLYCTVYPALYTVNCTQCIQYTVYCTFCTECTVFGPHGLLQPYKFSKVFLLIMKKESNYLTVLFKKSEKSMCHVSCGLSWLMILRHSPFMFITVSIISQLLECYVDMWISVFFKEFNGRKKAEHFCTWFWFFAGNFVAKQMVRNLVLVTNFIWWIKVCS